MITPSYSWARAWAGTQARAWAGTKARAQAHTQARASEQAPRPTLSSTPRHHRPTQGCTVYSVHCTSNGFGVAGTEEEKNLK